MVPPPTPSFLLKLAVVLSVSAAALAASTGAATPAEARYVAAVKRDYLPLRSVYATAQATCTITQNDARCQTQIVKALAATKRLDGTLARTAPPARLGAAHRSLRSALGQLVTGFNRVTRALHSGAYSPFNFIDFAEPAAKSVDGAVASLNKIAGAKLPRFTPRK